MGILRRQIEQVEEEYADDSEFEARTADTVDAATRLFGDLTLDESMRSLDQFARSVMPALIDTRQAAE